MAEERISFEITYEKTQGERKRFYLQYMWKVVAVEQRIAKPCKICSRSATAPPVHFLRQSFQEAYNVKGKLYSESI